MSEQTVLSSALETGGEGTVLSSTFETGGEGTVLSTFETGSEGTVLSTFETGGEGTMLSSILEADEQWDPEYLLEYGDKVDEYTITGAISGAGAKKSGEAQVYKAEKDGKEYVIKVYRQDISLKEDVAELLVGKQIPYLAYMVKIGSVPIRKLDGKLKQYEISPLYRNFPKPVPYKELCRMIEQVNEGLHSLHEMRIYHKDIKPANILIDDENNYRIIDFGISSVASEGQTHLITKTGISEEYAAPESRSSRKFGPLQDYYSLGISLYHLFTGELPYAEMKEEYERYDLLNTVGINIRESLGMPPELVKLIHGLTFYSNNADINKKRWGYEQVKQWLTNPEGMEDLDMKAYADTASGKRSAGNPNATITLHKSFGFNNKQIYDSYTLADELGSHWDKGKKQVGRGYVEELFKDNGSEFNEYRSAAEDTRLVLDNPVSRMAERQAFWKLLYTIEPKLKKFYWYVDREDGRSDYTCEELGYYLFLEPLQNKVSTCEIPPVIQELIDSKLIPVYLKDQLQDEARFNKAEKLIQEFKAGDKEIAAWRLGYLLAGKALFTYHGQQFETREQLYQHVIEWTNSLSTDEALEVAKAFPDTKEFRAWIQNQEDEA